MHPVKRVVLLALMALFMSITLSLRAQVGNFSLFKVTVYHQACASPPTTPDAPDAYYFGAQLHAAHSDDYAKVSGAGPGKQFLLNESASGSFNFGSPYFTDKADFDAAYPGGGYQFAVDFTDNAAEFGSATIPDADLYPTNIAAFTTNCWAAMQQVDPARDLPLEFNSFVPTPNSVVAYTFIKIFNAATGETPFDAELLPPDTVATNIPANTLRYGATYRVDTFFSDRQEKLNAGFSAAFSTVGFDNLTYTTLTTIEPSLNVAAAGTNIILAWPAPATNFALQCASRLPADIGSWTTVTNAPAILGNANSLTLPMTGAAMFFRLKPL